MSSPAPYQSKHKIRILTAGSLFDGHDVAINVMRRILQSSGAEVIHLGHNRSVAAIVKAAVEEDVQGIALTSYQGGHMEFFKYTYDLLRDHKAGHIKVFGGGGGTILPEEIEALHSYGIDRVFSPEDGRKMGLQGMINEVLKQSDFACWEKISADSDIQKKPDRKTLGRLISSAENLKDANAIWLNKVSKKAGELNTPVLGITGTGGAGKSSLVDELVLRYLEKYPDKSIGILSVDPTRRRTGGALLGDRIRMNSADNERVYMRSMATRMANTALSPHTRSCLDIMIVSGFDLIILETSGIGQSDSHITELTDFSLYVMTPEFGAATQLEKIDMIDMADIIAINKFDKQGASDALRQVRKQYQRNHGLWDKEPAEMPVFGTVASQFNDPGTDQLFTNLMALMSGKSVTAGEAVEVGQEHIIPPARVRYLSEIVEVIHQYDKHQQAQSELVSQWYCLQKSRELIEEQADGSKALEALKGMIEHILPQIDERNRNLIRDWPQLFQQYTCEFSRYEVRGKTHEVSNYSVSLSGTQVPKVSLPDYRDWGDILKWQLQENVPGKFPYTAGVFPFKRKNEDPTRMFAGEGGPEETNRRFHYVSEGMPAKRLSTAFDSVTLYGENPAERPDIYGKVGNSGVSICSLDDAKKLYSGFDLCDPSTSVSMTINGPAATICAFFLNAAVDQQCEKYIGEHQLQEQVDQKLRETYDDRGIARPTYALDLPAGHNGLGLLLLGVTGDQILPSDIYHRIRDETLKKVRGTVQADILKEDQAQNTCIFSTGFSLRLMGDMQQYFTDNGIRNFYSVSISGYHIAEAGANPITQLAFTLSNGFTYIEYYLSRGMDIDEFAPNLSFFFSNGVDAEYAVIGRVARRIWAKALREKYGANERSQKLKYHIQTSGRSLHAQEISFNDIRTTLQALYAIYDNCNSLHTNAYDEAITTPTEESVRRALAIQLIINKELGLAKNENPLQGSFIIRELTDLVEEAVLAEFERISSRGGVLGAMEKMYQRSKIQEESLYYESRKHSGTYPVVGVNTFVSPSESEEIHQGEVIRASRETKERQISNLARLHKTNEATSKSKLEDLQSTALRGDNVFEALMETTKTCSLGQITHALFEVGGQYRRNM